MPDTVRKVGSLIIKYWRQELEEEELNFLIDWANQSRANRQTFNKLTDPAYMVGNLKELSTVKQALRDRVWAELEMNSAGKVFQNIKIQGHTPIEPPVPSRISWKRVAVAAGFILAIGLLVFLLTDRNKVKPGTTELSQAEVGDEQDAALKPYTAGSIRFADGNEVDLSTIPADQPYEYGALRLVRQNGLIKVVSTGNPMSKDSAMYNSIQVPNGGAYVVLLPDGTSVSMNAASSLSFPVAFSPTRRQVEVKGEAFFKVMKSNSANGNRIPFFVHTKRMNIEVLGTSFNVNVYPEQKLAKTTLKEGILKVWKQDAVTSGKAPQDPGLTTDTLWPGQQAQVSDHYNEGSMGIRIDSVNINEVLSWREGIYSYSEIGWDELMAHLTRWFNARFEFPGGMPDQPFSGIIYRKDGLATTLNGIGKSDNIVFDVKENNTVIVTLKK